MIKIIGSLDLKDKDDDKAKIANKEIKELTISGHKYINYSYLWYHLPETQESNIVGTSTALINESEYHYSGPCSKEVTNLLNVIMDLLDC